MEDLLPGIGNRHLGVLEAKPGASRSSIIGGTLEPLSSDAE